MFACFVCGKYLFKRARVLNVCHVLYALYPTQTHTHNPSFPYIVFEWNDDERRCARDVAVWTIRTLSFVSLSLSLLVKALSVYDAILYVENIIQAFVQLISKLFTYERLHYMFYMYLYRL